LRENLIQGEPQRKLKTGTDLITVAAGVCGRIGGGIEEVSHGKSEERGKSERKSGLNGKPQRFRLTSTAMFIAPPSKNRFCNIARLYPDALYNHR